MENQDLALRNGVSEFCKGIGARLAVEYRALKVLAEMEAERVAKYTAPLLAEYGFRDEAGQIIADTARLYLSDDARLDEFYSRLDVLHRENGFRGQEGCSPDLLAARAVTMKENEICEAFSKSIAAKGAGLFGERRKKLLELVERL